MKDQSEKYKSMYYQILRISIAQEASPSVLEGASNDLCYQGITILLFLDSNLETAGRRPKIEIFFGSGSIVKNMLKKSTN